MIKMQSLRKQRGAATLLVGILTILIVTIGSFALTRQISADSGSNNSLYFRNKALEAANAGIASLIADISDKNSARTYLDNLDALTVLTTITIDAKYAYTDTGYTLKIMKIANDPSTGATRIHVQSTGCYPTDCSSGKAIVEQDIVVSIKGGLVNDWLSVNKSLNRMYGSSINVHNAPQGTTGSGLGGINNCTGGDVINPTNCVSPGVTQMVPPEGGNPIDVYATTPNVYYTNWEPTPGAPAGTNCRKEPDSISPNCAESSNTPGKNPAVRPQLSNDKYFEKYYGDKSRAEVKTSIQDGDYSAPSFPASSYVWVDGDVTMKSDGKLYNNLGSVIPTDGKHVIIDGNLSSDPIAWPGITVDAANDSKWSFLYVAGNMKMYGALRINGPLAVQGDFNLNGSLQFYAKTADDASFPPMKDKLYSGKSGWRDF